MKIYTDFLFMLLENPAPTLAAATGFLAMVVFGIRAYRTIKKELASETTLKISARDALNFIGGIIEGAETQNTDTQTKKFAKNFKNLIKKRMEFQPTEAAREIRRMVFHVDAKKRTPTD